MNNHNGIWVWDPGQKPKHITLMFQMHKMKPKGTECAYLTDNHTGAKFQDGQGAQQF